MDIIWGILQFLLVSFLIQCAIAAVLILFGKSRKNFPQQGGLAFGELLFDYSNLPSLKSFPARDGSMLSYRYYPSSSDTMIILIHGSGWHSRYFLPLAESLSNGGGAQICTPDLRGHGTAPHRRGDIEYIDQMEDDLMDLVQWVRDEHPHRRLIIGGHSSGGGLVIRFAGGRYFRQADAYVLLSPFLKYNAPTVRPDSGGWANAYTKRIAGMSILNMMGIRLFNNLPVIEFNMPEEVRDGTETLSYSYRLNTGYAPRNYRKDLRAIWQPMLVVAGTADDAFVAEQFEPEISQYANAQYALLQGVSHMGAVVNPEVVKVLSKWLKDLDKEFAAVPAKS